MPPRLLTSFAYYAVIPTSDAIFSPLEVTCDKLLQSGLSKEQKFILTWFWKPESEIKVLARLSPIEA
jgi:hypothetical protein